MHAIKRTSREARYLLHM